MFLLFLIYWFVARRPVEKKEKANLENGNKTRIQRLARASAPARVCKGLIFYVLRDQRVERDLNLSYRGISLKRQKNTFFSANRSGE